MTDFELLTVVFTVMSIIVAILLQYISDIKNNRPSLETERLFEIMF